MKDRMQWSLWPRHERQRWAILVISSAAYLCSHSYLFATFAVAAFDLLAESTLLAMGGGWQYYYTSGGQLAVDYALRVLTVFAAVTLNAFTWYAFDLSFLYGLQWLYFSVTTYLYFISRCIDTFTQGRYYVDVAFAAAALPGLAFFMNFIAYGEPYTFMTQMIYILSVTCLMVTSLYYRWLAVLFFVFFWIVAIAVGLIVNTALDRDYRYSVSHYFSQTPWL